jgi:hypothetical protein
MNLPQKLVRYKKTNLISFTLPRGFEPRPQPPQGCILPGYTTGALSWKVKQSL